MHLTPAILRSCYAFLLNTPPFTRLGLPKPGAVEFQVIADRQRKGWCGKKLLKNDFILAISYASVSHTNTLICTMAHEMCHIPTWGKDRGDHGAHFMRLARRVCKHHGFDPKEF